MCILITLDQLVVHMSRWHMVCYIVWPARPIINPRCMREGYGSRSVCVCVSVSALAATYLFYTLKTRYH